MLNARILISKETVNDLITALQRAYKAGDARLVRRISALISLSRGEKVSDIVTTLGVAPSSVYEWLKQLMVEGVAGLKPCWKGGRPAKLTPSQRKRLAELIDAGPQAAGFRSACWNSVMIQELILREFGKLYNVHYVSDLLKGLGFSFQKARFISGHLDEERRRVWLAHTWPQILKQARAVGGLILFGDEASFAQWGSLGYTWARRGQQPVVQTSGKRRAYKVFGLIEFFSGQFFYAGLTGKFNSESYIAFLTQVLEQTTAPLLLIQDGARYHTSKATRQFFAAHADRLTVFQLPSYSPDYNPIEYLWRNVKQDATHLKYFPTFESLMSSVEETLTDFQTLPAQVKGLFGRYLELMVDSLPAVA
jgi:transposase